MTARLALLLLALPAAAMNVRVPSVPAKFTGGNASAAWRAWEGPMLNTYVTARGDKLALAPELEAFAPVIGAAKKDGQAAPFAPRSSAIHLLTVQLEEAGLKPADFAALPVAERVAKMQAAYESLRGELQAAGEGLAKAAEEAEKAGDRAALHEAQTRLSLVMTLHSDYIAPQVLKTLRAARDKAFAAHAKLTDTVVDGAAKSAADALSGAAKTPAKQGFEALGDAPDPWRGAINDPHKEARKQLLAPLAGGNIPADFVEAFARYQQMGDPNLSFDALVAFKAAADNPFATGPNAARALAGIGLIAREAPAQRARDLALQALMKNRFLAPELESLRVFTMRDVGTATTDKEVMGRIIKALAADAGVKREGPAGEALAAVEDAWKKAYGIPNPVKAKAMREGSGKHIKNGLMGLVGGGVSLYFFGAVTWLGAFGAWLPYIGLGIGALTLLYGVYLRVRSRAR